MTASTFNASVYRIVTAIPPGRLLSYAAVARLIGVPTGARAVGWALRLVDSDGSIPWHRVINSKGYISTKSREHAAAVQRDRLVAEGIAFDEFDHVDLARFMWQPDPVEVRAILENG